MFSLLALHCPNLLQCLMSHDIPPTCITILFILSFYSFFVLVLIIWFNTSHEQIASLWALRAL